MAENTEPSSTARLQTHAEWCQHLWRIGSLKTEHYSCQWQLRCVAQPRAKGANRGR